MVEVGGVRETRERQERDKRGRRNTVRERERERERERKREKERYTHASHHLTKQVEVVREVEVPVIERVVERIFVQNRGGKVTKLPFFLLSSSFFFFLLYTHIPTSRARTARVLVEASTEVPQVLPCSRSAFMGEVATEEVATATNTAMREAMEAEATEATEATETINLALLSSLI